MKTISKTTTTAKLVKLMINRGKGVSSFFPVSLPSSSKTATKIRRSRKIKLSDHNYSHSFSFRNTTADKTRQTELRRREREASEIGRLTNTGGSKCEWKGEKREIEREKNRLQTALKAVVVEFC